MDCRESTHFRLEQHSWPQSAVVTFNPKPQALVRFRAHEALPKPYTVSGLGFLASVGMFGVSTRIEVEALGVSHVSNLVGFEVWGLDKPFRVPLFIGYTGPFRNEALFNIFLKVFLHHPQLPKF